MRTSEGKNLKKTKGTETHEIHIYQTYNKITKDPELSARSRSKSLH